MQDLKELISACDADIRSGQVHRAAARLSRLNSAKIRREWRLPLARLCRRSGLFNLGLSLLQKIIYPRKTKLGDGPTPAELAEYSVLLLRASAYRESLEVLEKVDASVVPEAHLFRAFIHFTRWEYAEAIPKLQKFVAAVEDPYQKSIGRTNLAQALVSSKMDEEAHSQLAENLQFARETGSHRLMASSHIMRAQLYIQSGELAPAENDLEAAAGLLGPAWNMDRMIHAKWSAVLNALKSGDIAPLEAFRELARSRSDFDALREIDLFRLKLRFEPELYRHLLFGSPFPSFRERCVSETGRSLNDETYVFGNADDPILDLRTAQIEGAEGLLPGRKIHRLLDTLLTDFYKPLRLGGLFSELFPGEHYDVFTSPDRVHQLLRRSRNWLRKTAIPVSLLEFDGFYRLEISGRFAFRVPLQRDPIDHISLQFKNLQKSFGSGQDFTALEAENALGVSRWTALRLIDWAEQNGHLIKQGSNRKSRYRLVLADKIAA